jgi:hypothetical protein
VPGQEPAVSPCVCLLDALQSLKQSGFELLLRLALLVFSDEGTDAAAGGTISPRLYLYFNKSLQRLRSRDIQWAYLPHFPG